MSRKDLETGLRETLKKLGEKRKGLAIPPNYTHLPSRAGELTEIAWEYYGDKLTDILPALGTHTPMTDEQISHMFGKTPASLIRVHDWQNDVITLARIPTEFVEKVSENKVHLDWPVQVNKLLVEGNFDLIISIGQVVPHEVVGMANYQDGRVHGYQFEIDPSERAWTGGIYDEARRGWLYPVTYNPIGQKAFKNNEWNKRLSHFRDSLFQRFEGLYCNT